MLKVEKPKVCLEIANESKAEYVLVVASSARLLAQTARVAGFKPLVIDLFADQDAQYYAHDFKQIISLAKQHLKLGVDYFIKTYQVDKVVYGSGFEHHPESLCYLNSCLSLFGNTPEVFIDLHDKPAFFATLKHLAIPYPQVHFIKPNEFGGWLIKPMRGQGGEGIKHYLGEEVAEGTYWQRYQTGKQYSVLFLADGLQVQVVGFNSQWTTCLDGSREFMFSGIINACDLKAEQQSQVVGWLKSLVPLFKLKGLNSLDFITDGDCSWLLEINPRPPASMQLYEADLFNHHVSACLGQLTNVHHKINGYTGYQVVYAQHDIMIPDGFLWPEICLDLPETGVICRTGQPICSIMSHKMQAHLVMSELQTQQINLQKRFSSWNIKLASIN
jgi:predicted ATP-grasp superfamily ATP-dependent carboligase